jgi:hypothetical protein
MQGGEFHAPSRHEAIPEAIHFPGQGMKYSAKLFPAFRRHYARPVQTTVENTVQNMNKTVTVFLIHIETGCMIFLKRVILQI